jgi:hypothetical protein
MNTLPAKHATGVFKRGKGSKIMVIGDASGLPVSAYVASASPHEITLMEKAIEEAWPAELPGLTGDKTYDSDKHDERPLEEKDIILIEPNKVNWKSPVKSRMTEFSDVINAVGRSKELTLGCRISGGSLSGGSLCKLCSFRVHSDYFKKHRLLRPLLVIF